jgi:gliding motility-associated-like protein
MADIKATSLGGVPKGTTANRPASPSVGDVYYNGDLGYMEMYTSQGWFASSPIIPGQPTSLVATNQGICPDTVVRQIKIKDELVVYVPNAFTPNDDTINDIFKVVGKVDSKDFTLEIFNKWGERIFVSNDPSYGWDGTYKGRMVQDDLYVYKIMCKINSKHFIKYGSVTLIK